MNVVSDTKCGFFLRRELFNETMYTPEDAAAEIASEATSFLGSTVGSGSCEATSLWVLESRLGTLGTAQGCGNSRAAPVWSSERLFPTRADKKRKLFNYQLTSTNVDFQTSALWSISHDYSGYAILE